MGSLLSAAAPEAATAIDAADEEADYGVQRLYSFNAQFGRVTIAAGSVVVFSGDAIVNAANTGCLGGGGIDGAISNQGGEKLYEARCRLPIIGANSERCAVGDAKTTEAGDLETTWVIHAVGPAYHFYDTDSEADALLYSAYRSAMREARLKRLSTVGFSLLSAGIFRGSRPLEIVLRIGVVAVAANAYAGLKEAVLVAYTPKEQETLLKAAERLYPQGASELDWEAALEGIASPQLLEIHKGSLAEQAEQAKEASKKDGG